MLFRLSLVTASLSLALACGGEAPAPAPAEPAPAPEAAPAADPHAGHEAPAADAAAFVPATGGKVSFVGLTDGAVVKSPLHVTFAVEGLTVQPAGTMDAGTGHHHIVIDGEPVAEGQAVPTDAQHIHFGKGQTEADVELTPGPHKLTLQFADGLHRSYGPAISQTVSVTVE